MPAERDETFARQREVAFSRIITHVTERISATTPVVVVHLQEKSPGTLRANATVEAWSLFLNGIRHLRNGAPDGQPGSMHESLSRASLRASPLAAALGIRPPQFEPLFFSIDYNTGEEAAIFLCRQLVEAAEADFPKSRQLIQQKILAEKPAVDTLKEQMALSFDVLAQTYERVCGEIKELLMEI